MHGICDHQFCSDGWYLVRAPLLGTMTRLTGFDCGGDGNGTDYYRVPCFFAVGRCISIVVD